MPSRELDSRNEYGIIFEISTVTTNNQFTPNGRVDLQNANAFHVVINIGAIDDGTHTVTLEDADDINFSTNLATVPDSDLRGAVASDLIFTSSDSFTSKDVGYVGNKRFIRMKISPSGATLGGTFGASFILSSLSLAPKT